MKLGIINEGKTPPDNRVPLTPEQCVEVQDKFQNVTVIVQSSKVRCFSDEDYQNAGIHVQEDLSDCDVLLGVKEVPVNDLIPGKIYFFFSHTIKKQAYNRRLLQTILGKNIQLVDYEVLTDNNGLRIIGFGRFAGLVGAYSGIRGFGLRNEIFRLKPAYKCSGLDEMFAQLSKIEMPPVKIALTGDGRVALLGGADAVHRYPPLPSMPCLSPSLGGLGPSHTLHSTLPKSSPSIVPLSAPLTWTWTPVPGTRV